MLGKEERDKLWVLPGACISEGLKAAAAAAGGDYDVLLKLTVDAGNVASYQTLKPCLL